MNLRISYSQQAKLWGICNNLFTMKIIFFMLAAFVMTSCARRDIIGVNEYLVVDQGVRPRELVNYLEEAKRRLKRSDLTKKGLDPKREPRMTIIDDKEPFILVALPTKDGISGSETWVIVTFAVNDKRMLRITQMCVSKK